MQRDPKQPTAGGAPITPVAIDRQQGGGEHLAGQVSRELRAARPPGAESQNPADIAAIELGKRLRMLSR
jgi:hypothetical protein